MQISKDAIFQASRIIHSKDTIFSIPDDVTIEWREALFQVLEEEYSREVINQCISNGSRGYAGKPEQEDLYWENLQSQDTEITLQVLSLIELYFHFAEKEKEGFAKNEKEEKLGKCYEKLQLSSTEKRKVSILKKNLLNKFKSEKYQKTLFIPASIIPVSIDFILRFSSLWVLNLIFYFQDNTGQIFAFLFFLLKIIGIALIVLWFAKIRQKKIGRYYEHLFSNFHEQKPSRIKIQPKAWQFTLIVLMAAFEGNLMYVLFDEFSDIDYFLVGYIGLFFALITFLYLYFVLNTISPGKLKISKLLALKKDELTFLQKLSADENDEAFVRLETGFVSKKQRIEAYVIESTLFGALSFSAFLQLIANDLITLAEIEDFAVLYYEVFQKLLLLNFDGLFNSMGIMTEKTHVFSILAILTLLCSIMFLVVIASRLKFRDVSDKLEQCFNLIRSLNNKEEDLLLKDQTSKEDERRFKLLNQKILNQLNEANGYVREINPIAGFMQYFRDLGVVIFFVILIASGLFFSKFLAIAFSLLAIFTILYFNSDTFIKKGKAAYYWFKDDFLYIGKTYLLPLAIGITILMVLLAFIGKYNYRWQPLATFSFALLSVVRIVQIFFYNQEDIEINKDNSSLIKVFRLNKIQKIGWILAELSLFWFFYLVLFDQSQFSVLLLLTMILLYTALIANKSFTILGRSVWAYLLALDFILLFVAIFSNFLGLEFAESLMKITLIIQGLLIAGMVILKVQPGGMLWRSLILANILCLGIFFFKEELKVAFNYGNINPGEISKLMEMEEFNEKEENTNLERYEELCEWYMSDYLINFSEEKQPEAVYGLLLDMQDWVGDSTLLKRSIYWTDEALTKSNSSDLAYLKGLIYRRLNDHEQAIYAFKQGVEFYEIKPGKIRPEVFYNNLAYSFLQTSLDSSVSEQALEYAKKAFDESIFYTQNYMKALLRLKKYEEAIQLLEGDKRGTSNIGNSNDKKYYSANLIFSTTEDSAFLETALAYIDKTTDLKKDVKKAELRAKILNKLDKEETWDWLEISGDLYSKETDNEVKAIGLNNIATQSCEIISSLNPEKKQKVLDWIKTAIKISKKENNYVYGSTLAMVLSAVGENEKAILEANKVISRGYEVDRHFIHPGVYYECSNVFLNSTSDSALLLKAREWSEKSVEFRPLNYDYWNNYVNILEKTGPPLAYKKAVEEKRKLGLKLGKEELELL
ncbi:MAG: hypothetical protein KTR26_17830 [Flammeovirgaceae bacterium]|nr:hypothetical protein [Flammeovirgaceae bacterium]